MPLPSLYISADRPREWSIARAATYGAALGAVAGLLKAFGPLHKAIAAADWSNGILLANIPEIAAAAVGFALLCAGAAALRNLIARRLIWPEQS